MDSLSLGFVRQIINQRVTRYSLQPVKVGYKPKKTYRMTLHYMEGHPGISSLIVKSSPNCAPNNVSECNREGLAYQILLPKLKIKKPEVFYNGLDQSGQSHLLFLEDLQENHIFPEDNHLWSRNQIKCVLRTYARLHISGEAAIAATGTPNWMFTYLKPEWDPVEIQAMFQNLVEKGIWSQLPGFSKLVSHTYEALISREFEPLTTLHHDSWPSNIALPMDFQGEGVLVDWEMAGWGIAELDLAYMYIQPYQSARKVDQRSAIEYYWTYREDIEGKTFPRERIFARQRYANAILAISLVVVANQVANNPYPSGSAPHAYWLNMFKLLFRELSRLCETQDP
jgi:thiamine kinase-like enzyme